MMELAGLVGSAAKRAAAERDWLVRHGVNCAPLK